MYKNYIFDLYGTLLDIRTDEEMESLWSQMAAFYSFNGAVYNAGEFKEKFSGYCADEEKTVSRLHPEYAKIDIVIDQAFKRLYCEKGIKPTDELVKVSAKLFRCLSTTMQAKPYDGVLEFFDELHKREKKIFLLSNAQSSFTVPELKLSGLYDKFDGILISSEELCRKPDPAFYQKLFDRYKLKKSESIMIGNDESSDIKGANDFGIDSLYIHTKISPPLNGALPHCKYVVFDGEEENGDFRKIVKLILKQS